MTEEAGGGAASVEAALQRLKRFHPQTIDLGLDRVHRLLAALGDPHCRLPPVIHVAGTNGKGSTVAFLRAFLEAAGQRVHAYTSPHLERFNERIRLAGRIIGDAELAALLERVERTNNGQPITFFEATSCAAYLAMAETEADVVLLETGLGGRLDATNVIDRPAVTAITPIGMDHMSYLGDTLAGIAAEKAGILKPGITAVLAPQRAEAAAVLRRWAERVGAPVYAAGEAWHADRRDGGFSYDSPARRLHGPLPALPGDHQIVNAGTALAVLDCLAGVEVPDGAVLQGLRTVAWPGRLQHLTTGRLAALVPPGAELWVDAAHNEDGAVELARFLAGLPAMPTHLALGMYYDKQAPAFLARFQGVAHQIHAVEFVGEQPCQPAAQLVDAAHRCGIQARVAEGVEAVIRALGTGPWRLVVTGSVALVGRILAENRP